jgi:hypothetical protein
MTRTTIVIAAGLALAVTLLAVQAQAQSPRTFVSAAGSDSNPCSFAAPCRHFQAAVNATTAGGEVDALDPAGYGPITITQAITIEGQGWSYIAPPASGNAITINAVSGNVALRGVSLNGVGITGNTNGIEFNTGASLSVQNSVIQNFSGAGIYFDTSDASSLFVTNTSASNNGADGISVFPTSAGVVVQVVLNRVEANNNGRNGIGMNASRGANNINATASDSVAAGNAGIGFNATSGGSGYASFSLFHCVTSNNGTGMEADGVLGILVLSQTLVGAGNQTFWQIANNGTINSFQDNYSYFGNAGGVTPASKF